MTSVTERLLSILRCPHCGSPLRGDEELTCDAGHRFAVTRGIPRLLSEGWSDAQRQRAEDTRNAFGKQWLSLGRSATVTESDLLLHLPSDWTTDVFSGLVLDLGCGMGRYAGLVAEHGREVVGLDASDAVELAVQMFPAVSFVQGDIASPPFEADAFDVVYSFGVLHHLPDPLLGLRSAYALVRPGGSLLVWVYSEHGGLFRRGRRFARRITRHVRLLIRPLAGVAAGLLWLGYFLPARLLHTNPRRLSFYREKGFRQLFVDCYDAISAPEEVYLSADGCEQWLTSLHPAQGGYEGRRDGSGWVIWATKPSGAR